MRITLLTLSLLCLSASTQAAEIEVKMSDIRQLDVPYYPFTPTFESNGWTPEMTAEEVIGRLKADGFDISPFHHDAIVVDADGDKFTTEKFLRRVAGNRQPREGSDDAGEEIIDVEFLPPIVKPTIYKFTRTVNFSYHEGQQRLQVTVLNKSILAKYGKPTVVQDQTNDKIRSVMNIYCFKPDGALITETPLCDLSAPKAAFAAILETYQDTTDVRTMTLIYLNLYHFDSSVKALTDRIKWMAANNAIPALRAPDPKL